MSDNQQAFFDYVDDTDHINGFITRLTTAVSHKSVSGDSSLRQDVRDMGTWLKDQLESLGADAQLIELGDQPDTDPTLQLPPLVVGSIGADTSLKTVLIYGHYDVQPADATEWAEQNPDSTDPFVLTRIQDSDTDKLVGRGSTDDKGPVMGWLNVFEAHKELNLGLPVNVRFVFEGMEESGSVGLDDWIKAEAEKGDQGLFSGVDCVCITDNYWLTTYRPTLTYGVRGIAYFTINITGATDDLHSGIYGRMIHEPMTDMVKLLATLVEPSGLITIPGVETLVDPPTDEEKEEYANIHYTVDDLVNDTGNHVELSEDPTELLMGRMRYPSLSIHGIKGAFDGDGTLTVIPHNISGRFSLRIVDPQTPDIIEPLVRNFLDTEFTKLNSKNTMEVVFESGSLPWVGDKDHWNFQAADAATQTVHGTDLAPDYTREGGTIPLALLLQDELNVNVLLLPMGRSDDGAHSLSEKIDVDNYVKGTKVFGSYLYELAKVETGVARKAAKKTPMSFRSTKAFF